MKEQAMMTFAIDTADDSVARHAVVTKVASACSLMLQAKLLEDGHPFTAAAYVACRALKVFGDVSAGIVPDDAVAIVSLVPNGHISVHPNRKAADAKTKELGVPCIGFEISAILSLVRGDPMETINDGAQQS